MVNLRPNDTAPVQPKPKYGHLSEIDPDFALLKKGLDQQFAQLWSLPLDEFKSAWLNAPLVLPEDVPQPRKDYEVEDQQATARDGTKLGVRLYKPKPGTGSGVLVLKAHGGGMLCLSFRVPCLSHLS